MEPVDNENVHNVNIDDELMLQDLFFENAIFKFYFFQNEDFTRGMKPTDVQRELEAMTFERAMDPISENHYLLKSSLE